MKTLAFLLIVFLCSFLPLMTDIFHNYASTALKASKGNLPWFIYWGIMYAISTVLTALPAIIGWFIIIFYACYKQA